MAKRSKPPGGGLTYVKIIAIGILSMVLLLAIVAQFGGKKQQPDASRRAARRTASASTKPTSPPAQSASAKRIEKRSENPWPTFEVAEVVTSNPFTLPEELLPEREAAQTLTPSSTLGEAEAAVRARESAAVREMRRRQAEFLAGLRAEGVDMILRSPRGSVARIGELSLRAGDIHEGLRVEEIGEYGIIFAPALAAEGQPE